MSPALTTLPPIRPRKLSVLWERRGDHAELISRRRDWGTGGFLLLWLTGWTVGCIFLVGLVLTEPHFFTLLFALPFWAAWFFVSAIVLDAFFRCERLTLDRSGAEFQREVLVRLTTRQVPLAEIQRFAEYSRVTDSESGATTTGIEMHTLGAGVRLVEGVRREELEWLLWDLNDHLRSLGVAVPAPVDENSREEEANDEPDSDQAEDNESLIGQPLVLAAAPVAAPSDCRWERLADPDDFDAIVFQQRGRLDWAGLGVLIFINLFWNGIVGVFVCGGLLGMTPDGKGGAGFDGAGSVGWWGLFFFLIPFEVIGLLMFAGLAAILFDPIRKTEWRFTQYDVTSRWRWLSMAGKTWQYPVERLSRIEVRVLKDSKQFIAANQPETSFGLTLVDAAGVELATIAHLTEGEARWMGDTILRERKSWFGRQGRFA